MAIAQQTSDTPVSRPGWARATANWLFNRQSATVWALLILLSLAFWPTYAYWWGIWNAYQSPFGYGYLVPPTVFFLIFARRKAIAESPKSAGHWLALAVIVFAALLHSAALLARVNLVQSFAFFLLVMTVPYYVWGGAVYRHIWGALAYTATMLPWPPQIYGALLLPAQEISTKIAVKLLNWTGVAVEVTNKTQVSTGSGYSFEVAAACSGLTIIFPVFAIAILSVMMVKTSWWKTVLILALSLPLSVFANAVRIWTIAVIGENWGASRADSLHDPSGLAAVIFASILLTVLMALLKATDYKPEYMPSFAKSPAEEGK